MSSEYICPPVMICGFNRPDCLREVFESVRRQRPAQLFLVLDAPRENKPTDLPRYEACCKIFDDVDWPCEVKRNYAERNMGCRDRMSSGITWTFKHVDRAIILEDDVVPDQTFFRFCAELLEKYKDDNRVGMIAGHDEHLHLNKLDFHGDSYYFDRTSSIWGWATWRRAWSVHDTEMSYWPSFKSRFLDFNGIYRSRLYTKRMGKHFENHYLRKAGAWAGLWCVTMYKENWLCIHPTGNLISNVGMGLSSRTDAKCDAKRSPWDRRKVTPMAFPLKHPSTFTPRTDSEYYYFADVGNYHYIWNRLKSLPFSILRKMRHFMGIEKKAFK